MCVWQPESRSWWRHAAFSTSCLRCGKLWQSNNSCTLVAVLNGWLESKPSNLFCWENHHMSCMPSRFTVWAGQRVAMILGGFFYGPCCATILHLFSKITIFCRYLDLQGEGGLRWHWIRSELRVQPGHISVTDSTDQHHHQNSFPTPLLFPEETYSAASEECSPPIAVWHEREAHARPFDLLSTIRSLYWI